jgi:tyrosine-protein kinase Etk/Wzc
MSGMARAADGSVTARVDAHPQSSDELLIAFPYRRLRRALRRRMGVIALTVGVAALSAFLYSFVRAPVYETATVLFLTGQSENRMPTAPAQLAMLAGASASPNAKLVQALLGSRSLADSVTRRTALAKYAQRTMSPDGTIIVRVRHKDPKTAAAIANAYLPLLNAMVARVGFATASQKEEALERQIASARTDLERSEAEILAFQRGRATPEINQGQQASRTIDAAVGLQQRVTEKEIEVAQLRRTVTETNPQLRAAESELAAWRSQLAQLTRGNGGGVLTSLREAPGLRLSATRLLREFTKNEQVYITLAGSLAQTRLELKNNLPVVSVIDPATVPTQPIGPSRLLLVLAAMVLGAILGVALVIGAEILRDVRRRASWPGDADAGAHASRGTVHGVA